MRYALRRVNNFLRGIWVIESVIQDSLAVPMTEIPRSG